VTILESFTSRPTFKTPILISIILRLEVNFKAINSVSLFNTEMYIFKIYSRHNNSKTSLFKQYLFLKYIKVLNVANILVAAFITRLTPLCYLYLL
jgi:hypothetical protein